MRVGPPCCRSILRGEAMKQLLIYERPTPLNRDIHRHLRVHATPGDFRFAAHVNSVPLAATEFVRASADFPIVFAGEGTPVPAALLGLRVNENLMTDAEGRWRDGAYVPAFLRRYPFVLAEKPDSDDFTVCLDAAFSGLGGDGEPLFDEAGEDSPLLKNAVNFLSEYQQHLRRTRELVARLQELDLLVPKVVRVEPQGAEAFQMQGFSVVDETRLQALKGKPLQELMKSGDLGFIYAHLVSLARIERLTARLDARGGAPTH